MSHLPHLIIDLALILGAAAVITVIFKWLKQPLVLGYIIAGILISSNFRWFPNIHEIDNVKVWAEIGIIFLLFSLGLEFSFKKLATVGGSASVSAFVEAIGMAGIGIVIGTVLKWPLMDSIYLGAALAVSSTTIIIKAVEELGLKQKKFATLVFGILIVEDLITIAILVILTTLSVSKTVDGGEMLFSLAKLVFFIVLWFISGIFFIPTFLKRARKFMNDETLLVLSIALCFLMVLLAAKAGFSPALGAFVMGSLLAETTKAERIEHLVKPVKDLFGAIFFVSVGMMIDLTTIGNYIIPIILITVGCIVGKIITTGIGAYIAGNSLKVSLQTGMSLAQIGEFSFIIAALGLSLNATSHFLYPIIIAVSGITTFTTPYLIRGSEPFYKWIDKKLPEKLKNTLNKYSSEAATMSSVNDFQRLLKSFIINIIVFSVIIVGLVYLSSYYLGPWLLYNTQFYLGGFTPIFLTILVMLPFLYGLLTRNERNEAFAKVFSQNKYKGPIWAMRLIKIATCLFAIIFLINQFYSMQIALSVAIIIFLIFVLLQKRIQRYYDRIETRFIQNLNDRELQAEILALEKEAAKRNVTLAPWDAHMTTFEIQPEMSFIGSSLSELKWREKVGINIAKIKRGNINIVSPTGNERIYPGDILYVICTDLQEKKMNVLLRPDKKLLENQGEVEMELEKFTIENDSPYKDKSIALSGLRTDTNGLVVGIEREGKRILNPESGTVLLEGDVVWLVGEKKLVQKYT